jgi:hypothetical protein
MVGGIFTYVERLEMLAFFSGYPLVFFFVRFLTRYTASKNRRVVIPVTILPLSYAMIGTVYLGLQLKNLYPDFTIENLSLRIQQPYLMIWAIGSILFWVPAMSKRPLLSFLHSLIFFFLILKDLFFRLTGIITDPDILKNDMKVNTISVVLNLTAFVFLFLLSFLFPVSKKIKK